jgi:hypothetical protein
MSKHTPGPYQRDGDFVYALTTCTSGSFKGTPCNRWAAQVTSQNGKDGASQGECEAVATLFQVAPRMLEALKSIIENADSNPFLSVGHFVGHTQPQIRALIAKAEGREE